MRQSRDTGQGRRIAPLDSADPGLYTIHADEAPTLRGRRCSACGFVFFPPQDLGCESCGSGPDQLEERELGTNGTLSTSADVFFDPIGRAPYTAVEILLDEGPLVNGMLDETPGSPLPPGTRMRAVAVAVDDTTAELRFEPDSGAGPEKPVAG